MRPITLPASFAMPAMFRSEPFGFEAARVAEHHLPVTLEPVELVVGREEPAGHVLGGDREPLAGLDAGRPGALRFDLQLDLPEVEAKPLVREQRAGEQAGLAQDLKAVADSEHRAAVRGEAGHGLHGGSEPGDRASPQVVAVGEPAGDDHGVEVREIRLLVPDEPRVTDPLACRERVALVARPGELQHPESHQVTSTIS